MAKPNLWFFSPNHPPPDDNLGQILNSNPARSYFPLILVTFLPYVDFRQVEAGVEEESGGLEEAVKEVVKFYLFLQSCFSWRSGPSWGGKRLARLCWGLLHPSLRVGWMWWGEKLSGRPRGRCWRTSRITNKSTKGGSMCGEMHIVHVRTLYSYCTTIMWHCITAWPWFVERWKELTRERKEQNIRAANLAKDAVEGRLKIEAGQRCFQWCRLIKLNFLC